MIAGSPFENYCWTFGLKVKRGKLVRDPAVTAKIVKSRVLAGGRLSFGKWIFPVIANMAENDVIDQLVLLQPMATPASQVYYMDASRPTVLVCSNPSNSA